MEETEKKKPVGQISPAVIYLAAAVDLNKSEFDPFKMMAEKLKPATCFMPKDAFSNASDRRGDGFVVKMNSKAIRESDAVVVYFDPSSFSFGVPMEMLFAAYFDKPVIMVTKEGEPPSSIYASVFTSVIIREEDLCYEKLKWACTVYKFMKKENFAIGGAIRDDIIKDIFNKGE